MRKLGAMLLALLMMCVPGIAEEIDLAAYDDAALVTLLERLQDEVAERGITRTATAYAGTYICGVDLPVGKYILSSDGSQVNEHGIVEWTRYLDGEKKDYDRLYYDHRTGDEVYTVYISLVEGDVLVLPFTHTLTITPGVLFR